MKKEKKTKKKPYRSMFSNSIWSVRTQWKYGRVFLLILVLGVPIEVALGYGNVYLPSLVVREGTGGRPFEDIIVTVGFFLLMLTMLNLCKTVMNMFQGGQEECYRDRIVFLVRKKSLDCFYENFEKKNVRDLQSRAMESLNSGNRAITALPTTVFALIQNVISYLLFGGMIASFSPILLPIVMIAPILNYFFARIYNNWEHSRRSEWSDVTQKLRYVEAMPGDFAAAKDIRIYGLIDWFTETYRSLHLQCNVWEKQKSAGQFFARLPSLLVILLRDSLAYGILISMALKSQITVDEFILYFSAISSFATFFGNIINSWNALHQYSLKICDLREYLDMNTDAEVCVEASVEVHLNSAPEIVFDHVSFRYDGAEHDMICDFSLTIPKGESVALVGLNGAGKTTLVKLLCGLYHPTCGEIRINGVAADQFSSNDYYRLFSPVFQDAETAFFTLAETVAARLDETVDEERAENCLRMAGLGEKLDALPKGIHTKLDKQLHVDGIELSGGEKQKLMMARALYKDAPILVLDEPTAALDPIAENAIYEEYRNMTKNKTSLFISHRLASTRFCDKVIYMSDGKIVEIGTHEELLARGQEYSRLYEIQSCWYRDDFGKEAKE